MRGRIDVDGVLADWVGAITDEFPLEIPEDPPWDILGLYPPEEKQQIVESRLNDPDWWETIPVMDGAKEGMAYLKALGHEIKFVTAPWESCPNWKGARTNWLIRHFGAHPDQVHAISEKWKVPGDYLIDDKMENVKEYKLHHPQSTCFLYDNRFNQREYWSPRVTWATIRGYM